MVMAGTTLGMDAPFERPDIMAWTKIDGVWIPGNSSAGTIQQVNISECGSLQEAAPEWFQEEYGVDDSLRMWLEPPFGRDGAADDCISNQSTAGLSVFCMILFSLCVQAAEGLHYGIVPYVSRPALGIVSGMVGAGGNLGAVMGLRSFFFEGDIRRDEGFLRLGFLVIGLTATLFFVYFPDKGGMLFPAGGLGKYDPQIIKPPADYRGADSMDFANNKDSAKEKTSSTNEVAVTAA